MNMSKYIEKKLNNKVYHDTYSWSTYIASESAVVFAFCLLDLKYSNQ